MSAGGIAIGKIFGGIVVTGIAAFGGYNYATTGCVTGMGCSTETPAALTAVSTETADNTAETAEKSDSCCSLGTSRASMVASMTELGTEEIATEAAECTGDAACEMTPDECEANAENCEKGGACCKIAGEDAPTEAAASDG